MDEPDKAQYKRHVLEEMIVVVAHWGGEKPVVVGAVSEPTYEALVEEGRWEERKRAYLTSDLGTTDEDVDPDSLREIRVRAWLPDIYETPEVEAGDVEAIEEDRDGE